MELKIFTLYPFRNMSLPHSTAMLPFVKGYWDVRRQKLEKVYVKTASEGAVLHILADELLDFVLKGLFAGLAEVNSDQEGGFAFTEFQRRSRLFGQLFLLGISHVHHPLSFCSSLPASPS